MGFRTVAIGRGRDKEKLAKDLGAHLYIDAAVEDAAAVLQRMAREQERIVNASIQPNLGYLVSPEGVYTGKIGEKGVLEVAGSNPVVLRL
jgi:D-arabinose 1-dehydrogenase-like Zn-dependent alcohol dehydrogenase